MLVAISATTSRGEKIHAVLAEDGKVRQDHDAAYVTLCQQRVRGTHVYRQPFKAAWNPGPCRRCQQVLERRRQNESIEV